MSHVLPTCNLPRSSLKPFISTMSLEPSSSSPILPCIDCVCVYTHTHTHTHTHIHTCTHTHTHIKCHICWPKQPGRMQRKCRAEHSSSMCHITSCIRIYMYIYACMYIYLYLHTHTCIPPPPTRTNSLSHTSHDITRHRSSPTQPGRMQRQHKTQHSFLIRCNKNCYTTATSRLSSRRNSPICCGPTPNLVEMTYMGVYIHIYIYMHTCI